MLLLLKSLRRYELPRLLSAGLFFMVLVLVSRASVPPETPEVSNRLVVLTDQGQAQELSKSLAMADVRVAERHRRVIEHLQSVAAASQPPVVATLNDLKSRNEVTSYHCYFVANCIAAQGTEAAFREIAQLPGVVRIEDDYRIQFDSEPFDIAPPRHLDDPSVELGVRMIRAPEVWEMGITGASVLVSHLDTGVNGSHPSLAGRWRGSYSYPWSACWYDLLGSTNTPTDNYGHGTQTMGIICGMTTGDTIGVAWGARYISARLNFANGNTIATTALLAFEWLLDPDGDIETFDDVPRVISNSWGFAAGTIVPCYNIFDIAVDNCEAAGSAVIWAAGNEGPGAETIRVPADRATTPFNSLSVGAFDLLTDSVWSSSSRGPGTCSADPELLIKPEVVAPGRNVRSASLGTTYATASGTSFATAHVAGTMALMLEVNPDLPVDSLKHLLMLTAADKEVFGEDNATGFGQIDALSAVQSALAGVGWAAGYVTDDLGIGIAAAIAIADYPHRFRSDSAGYFCFPMPAELPLTMIFSGIGFSTHEETAILTARDTLSMSIVLTSNGEGLLTGSVLSCLGVPAVGATVSGGPDSCGQTTTDNQGRFELPLPAGLHDVTASDGFCADALLEDVDIQEGGTTDVEFILPPNPGHVCSDADPYGYRICDDNDGAGVNEEWIEIAPAYGGTGIVHNLSDDGAVCLSLPFPVNFYGVPYEQIYVNGNGNLTFRRNLFFWYNTPLPLLYAPAIFAFWDDLADDAGGDICTRHDAARGKFIVEWSQVPCYDGEGTETFQVVVHDPAAFPTATGDAMIEVHYGTLSNPLECTVGLDADDNGNYVQYVFDGSYAVDASPLVNGRDLRMSTAPAFFGSPELAVVNDNITLNVAPGTFQDTAIVLSNTGSAPLPFQVSLMDSSASAAYVWTDSRNNDGVPFEFFDISATGEDLGIAADDTTTLPVRLPWYFPFYDRYFDRVAVCSNGFISFTSAVKDYTNERLADPDDPYYHIAPFWDDLLPCGGHVYTYADTIGERFLVQWDNVRLWASSCGSAYGPLTFQVVLHHDGTIDLTYANMGWDPSELQFATVGMRGRGAANSVQLAFNQAFVESDVLIRLQRPSNAAAVCRIWDNPQGVIAPFGAIMVPLRIWNDDLFIGTRDWTLAVASGTAVPSIVNLTVQPGLDHLDAHVTIHYSANMLVLSWRRFDTPLYCVFSGEQADVWEFEAVVPDTFYAVPMDQAAQKFFQIYLCDGQPEAQASPDRVHEDSRQ